MCLFLSLDLLLVSLSFLLWSGPATFPLVAHCQCQSTIFLFSLHTPFLYLKPENLLLAHNGADAPVKLTDFGLAVLLKNGPEYFGLFLLNRREEGR